MGFENAFFASITCDAKATVCDEDAIDLTARLNIIRHATKCFQCDGSLVELQDSMNLGVLTHYIEQG